MKKIMFNDKYGLTKAVLEGRKTQTRRVIISINNAYNIDSIEIGIDCHGKIYFTPYIEDKPTQDIYPTYQLEDIAVAQAYKNIESELPVPISDNEFEQKQAYHIYGDMAGWHNKMFIKAELMPYRIRITNIRVERLQDISDEDCLKEGIDCCDKEWGYWEGDNDFFNFYAFKTIKEAFAHLINKTCGKGTWDSNPWVFVYDFELIK